MKVIAAALLIALSGKEVTEAGIKKIFGSVGVKGNDAEIKALCEAMKGKKPEEIIAEGLKKVVAGGAAPAGAPAAKEEKKEEKKDAKKDDKKGGKDKKEEKKKKEEPKEEEEDDDMLGGLF